MNFDPTKPVATRDGRAARILSTDGPAGKPIVAAVRQGSGEIALTYQTFPGAEAAFAMEVGGGPSDDDLVNIPARKSTYYPLLSGGGVASSLPCAYAGRAKALSTIAKALKITCEGIDPVSAEIV